MQRRFLNTGSPDALRNRADSDAFLLRQRSAEHIHSDGIHRVLHELNLHQIELELQNDELRSAQLELAAMNERYFNLFNLAPVGIVTINDKGLIIDANMAATTRFGAAWQPMQRPVFTAFIQWDDQDVFYHLRRRLAASHEPQMCELRMCAADGTTAWMRLDAAAVVVSPSDEAAYHIVMTDIAARKSAERTAGELQPDAPAHMPGH